MAAEMAMRSVGACSLSASIVAEASVAVVLTPAHSAQPPRRTWAKHVAGIAQLAYQQVPAQLSVRPLHYWVALVHQPPESTPEQRCLPAARGVLSVLGANVHASASSPMGTSSAANTTPTETLTRLR